MYIYPYIIERNRKRYSLYERQGTLAVCDVAFSLKMKGCQGL